MIAQRQVYLQFAKAVWEQDKLNMCDFVSMAQLANATASLYIPKDRLHKVKIEDEAAFRQAYYGGRLVTTCTQWISEQWLDVELCDKHEEEYTAIWDSITDYLCYYDANSLYPSQMINKPIACGRYMFCDNVDLMVSGLYIQQMEDEAHREQWSYWGSRLVQVDITCPTDLLIPFLMRRNKEGLNRQTLEPIEKMWYAGPEILEAILLGYRVTRIYAYYRFPYYEVLYAKFIETNYQLRKKHRNGAKNILPKNKMNSASGKGGQGVMFAMLIILIGAEMFAPRPENTTEVKTIFADEFCDNPLACMVSCPQTPDTTPYCLNATVWILAWSRVHMSRFTRAINGYRSLEHVPIYGDTDSLFIRHSTVQQTPATWFGKELGQFKNEMPNNKIIHMIVEAPKTYMKEFLAVKHKRDGKCGDYYEKDGTLRQIPRISLLAHPEGRRIKDEFRDPIPIPGSYELMIQVTCKGIPHYSKPYRSHGEYELKGEKAQEVLDTMDQLKTRRRDKKSNDPHLFDHVHLRDRYHIFEQPGCPPRVFAAFTKDTFLMVHQQQASFTTVFGVMDRKLKGVNMEQVGIHLDYNSRQLAAEPFWNKGRRTRGEQFMTYPIGYKHN